MYQGPKIPWPDTEWYPRKVRDIELRNSKTDVHTHMKCHNAKL